MAEPGIPEVEHGESAAGRLPLSPPGAGRGSRSPGARGQGEKRLAHSQLGITSHESCWPARLILGQEQLRHRPIKRDDVVESFGTARGSPPHRAGDGAAARSSRCVPALQDNNPCSTGADASSDEASCRSAGARAMNGGVVSETITSCSGSNVGEAPRARRTLPSRSVARVGTGSRTGCSRFAAPARRDRPAAVPVERHNRIDW